MINKKWTLLLLTIIYLILLTYVSLSPGERHEEISTLKENIDNFGHIPAYSILTFLILKNLGSIIFRNQIFTFIIAVSYGILMEYLQSFVPYRYTSWEDVLSDCLGIGLTLILINKSSLKKTIQ